jgi:hypothetical protein
MKERKIRLKKIQVKQGLDTCEFEMALTGRNMKDLQETPLINAQRRQYGSVEASKGKATIKLNLPKFVRDNNIHPYSLTESIRIEIIRNDCETQLKKIFGNNINTQVTKIEVNITQPVSGNATQSNVLNLLSHATLPYTSKDNVKYVGPSRKCYLKEENHTVNVSRRHYYYFKFYDKSQEIIVKRRKFNLPIDDVPRDLLRMEIVFVERTLDKLFKSKQTLSDILTQKNLIEIIREYKRIFCDELVDGMIKPYLDACVLKLIESLTDTENPIKTIAKERELIPDCVVLQKALKRYMKIRSKTNNAARDTKRYAEQYDLPVDCIMTIHDFKLACG